MINIYGTAMAILAAFIFTTTHSELISYQTLTTNIHC